MSQMAGVGLRYQWKGRDEDLERLRELNVGLNGDDILSAFTAGAHDEGPGGPG